MTLVKDFAAAINANSGENESDTPDFILGQFAVDALAAANRAIRRRDEWCRGSRDADIAGALFDFAGFITTLEKPLTVGAAHDASALLTRLQTWAKERGLDLDRANVDRWNKKSPAMGEEK